MNRKSKIGVFDSGIGGLNVLNNLANEFPHEDFLYVGDNLNVPYGVKSREELQSLIRKIFNYFEKEDVKAIMVACNTASSASSDMKCNTKVFRIIEPTAKNALKISQNIAVVATDFTIISKAYDKYLNGFMTGIKASPLVMVAERGIKDTEEGKKIIKDVLAPYKDKCDTAILGCTHFPFLEKEIKKELNVKNIVDSSKSFSSLLKEYLDNNNLRNDDINEGKIEVCFTKKAEIDMSFFNHEYDGINFINI